MTKYNICKNLDEVCDELDKALLEAEPGKTAEIRIAKRKIRDIQISILEDLENEYLKN